MIKAAQQHDAQKVAEQAASAKRKPGYFIKLLQRG